MVKQGQAGTSITRYRHNHSSTEMFSGRRTSPGMSVFERCVSPSNLRNPCGPAASHLYRVLNYAVESPRGRLSCTAKSTRIWPQTLGTKTGCLLFPLESKQQPPQFASKPPHDLSTAPQVTHGDPGELRTCPALPTFFAQHLTNGGFWS